MSPRTGIPPTGNARKQKVETRMSTEELEKLDISVRLQVRRGLRLLGRV